MSKVELLGFDILIFNLACLIKCLHITDEDIQNGTNGQSITTGPIQVSIVTNWALARHLSVYFIEQKQGTTH